MPKRHVTIFSFHDGHDASAALIRDGRVLAAVQEERLNNIKHYAGTPVLSMSEVFRIAQIHPSEVDLIAIVNLVRVTPQSSKKTPSENLTKESKLNHRIWQAMHLVGYIPFVAGHKYANFYVKSLHKLREMRQIRKILEKLDLFDKEIVFVEHHLAHASVAYRSAPWNYDENTLVFTADGAGDGLSSTVSICRNGEIERIASSTYFDSLGNAFYGMITAHLGLRPWHDEYKTMGLAPYGKPQRLIDKMRRIIILNPDKPLEFKNNISPFIESKLRIMLCGRRFDDIAAAAQMHLEELLVSWIKKAIEITDVHKIACSGGVFLNVKANKKIAEIPEVEQAFFYPDSGDSGTTVGAALQAYFDYCKREGIKAKKVAITDIYYGPSYLNEQIEQVLKKTGWISNAEYNDEIDSLVGEYVAEGKIIARFKGSMEWGPRGLGNRSILADPRDLKVIGKINFAIKHRDFWMPFAPSIIEKGMDEYFLNPMPSPYMIRAFDTTEKRDQISAAIHPADKTCRPQTVNDSWNIDYRKVIEVFQERTGVGGVLNTSLNLHGFPIVCTPLQALKTFEKSKLDGLALGNYFLTK